MATLKPNLVLEQAGDRSTSWQILQRVYGFTLATNFEMQLHPVGSRRSHLGNTLPSLDLLALPHQQPAVVSVGAYIGIAVLDDHKFAVTP
ncbi:hypothetical protein A3710_09280 [Stutzerimonas frequens]|nr:hypothetical protein A3710_09280 [Stutzerimonas frequens]